MEKDVYIIPEIAVIRFTGEDVIVTSSGVWNGDENELPGGNG